jgi:diguanylate cyclase (GGDEF)-like protein/PAS domain S-box-containing protein
MEYNNRILIVDDNHSIHQDFQKILCPHRSEALRALDDLEQEIFDAALTEEKNGCETTTYTMDSAYQGLEAIEMVTKAANESRPYALIFMDVRMPPGLDGIETIARIWQHYPYVEMVICTAHADYSWDDIIARLGATDNLLFLKKPFDDIAVKQMAQALLKKWNLGEQARRQVQILEQKVQAHTRELRHVLCELHQRNKELTVAEEKFRVLTSSTNDAIVLMDNKGNISFWNPAAENMFGFSQQEIMGRELHAMIVPQRYYESFKQGFRLFQNTGDGKVIGKTLEISALHKDGTEFPVEISVSALQVQDKWYAAGIIRNITERKDMERKLEAMAHFDALTGLPNRALFFNRLTQFLALAQRHNYELGILYVDLDKFKDINDNLGHDVGDLTLKQVAYRLEYSLCKSDTTVRPSAYLRQSDTVARVGGDEFIIILAHIKGENDTIIVAKRIIRALSAPYEVDGHACSLGVSIGISIFPHHGQQIDELVKKADMAMYRAKKRGGNTYELFQP